MTRRAGRIPSLVLVALSIALLPPGAPSVAAETGFSARINAGGGAYTDPAGRMWAADAGFAGGNASVPVARPVARTDADPLYQKHRWSMSGYTLAVPCPATYRVDLHFADVYFNAGGQRVFSVNAEGVEKVSRLDVVAEAGPDTALVRTFDLAVNDGAVDLTFVRVVENPMVSAIEVTQVGACAGGAASPNAIARVSAGGGAYTDSMGRVWSADTGFVGGHAAVPTSGPIAGTDADPLYQKHRWAMSRYDLAVPCPAAYRVDLHFAEVYFFAPAQRVFSVSAEGVETISRLDVFAVAGRDNALVRSFTVTVSDGSLTLGFSAVVENPMVSAIEVTPADGACTTTTTTVPATTTTTVSATTTTVPASPPFSLRVNAGGGAYTDPSGRAWQADTGFVGGAAAVPTPSAIAGTDADPLYQKHRWAMSSYDLAVPCPATYRVELHLAEVYFYAAGQRVFSVSAEGVEKISRLDVLAAAGKDTALVRGFDVAVGDGSLSLGFTKVVDNPMVSAIEVTRTSACSATVAPPPAPVSYQVPSSIAADCSRPVDAEINAFLAGVPDNAVAVFAANGCYGQAGTITLADRTGLTVDGNGATFKALTAGDNVRKNWRLQGGSKLTLKNMTVRGANPAAGITPTAYVQGLEFQHGYSIEGTQGATLANVAAYDVYGDFVAIHHDERFNPYTTAPARNITITGARFERNGRQGISPTNVEGFVLEKSYLGAVNMNAVDIELDFNEARVTDVRIAGNTFGPVRFSLLGNVGAGSDPNVGRITLDDNTMVGPVLTCRPPVFVETPDGLFRSGYIITNNRFLAFGDAFIFSGAKNITVSGNTVGFTFAGCGTQAGVRLANSHTVSVTGNTFRGGSAVVVQDAASTGVTTSANT